MLIANSKQLKIIFSTEITVPIALISYGVHVGYDTAITLLHEAQVRFLTSHGYTELDIAGKALMVKNLEVNYKKEMFYADRLTIKLALADVNRAHVDMHFFVYNAEGILTCEAKKTWVFADAAAKKIVSTPDFFFELMTK